ncbi:hypothetical protein V6N13_009327 [Hibiscus sabdariffa]
MERRCTYLEETTSLNDEAIFFRPFYHFSASAQETSRYYQYRIICRLNISQIQLHLIENSYLRALRARRKQYITALSFELRAIKFSYYFSVEWEKQREA